MYELIPVLKKNSIDKIVDDLACRISSDYKNNELVLIGVLKGALVFLSDLMRRLTIPVKIDFVRVSSYGSGTSSSGKIRLTKEIEINIKNKDVLIIEDIVDTGLTLTYLVDYLKSFGPKSVKICSLLDKHERREVNIKVDYIGYVLKEGFIVGYGIDYNEDFRYLADIYHLKL
ncbi:MAG: hypoxanthine phosphoribosyltransferase [Candidatus Desulfaltia sp.]|nr:hypoxanthine phosphoribosyltransferase [Candidatus Desulfaltia sp.]